MSYLSKTISTLCCDIASMHDHSDPIGADASYDDVTEFVVEQLRKMPVFFSRPILLATAVFGVSRVLLDGSMFYSMPQHRRCLQVENWCRWRFVARRDRIDFYRSR